MTEQRHPGVERAGFPKVSAPVPEGTVTILPQTTPAPVERLSLALQEPAAFPRKRKSRVAYQGLGKWDHR